MEHKRAVIIASMVFMWLCTTVIFIIEIYALNNNSRVLIEFNRYGEHIPEIIGAGIVLPFYTWATIKIIQDCCRR